MQYRICIIAALLSICAAGQLWGQDAHENLLANSDLAGNIKGWDAALQENSAAIREATTEMLRDTYLKTQAVMQVLGKADLISPEARELMKEFLDLEGFLPGADLAADEFVHLAEARRGVLGRVQETHLSEAGAFWAAPLLSAGRDGSGLRAGPDG